MSLAVYVYQDASRNQITIDANDYNYTGTWSGLTPYTAATLDVVDYGNGRYIAIIDNTGVNPMYVPPRSQPKKWSTLAKIRDGDEPPWPPTPPGTLTPDEFYAMGTNALYAAWAGTRLAGEAYSLAAIGTNVGTNAYNLASGASAAAAAGIDLANQALQLAWIGTNASGDQTLAYNALQTAWSGTSGANAALGIAVAGTNGASAAVVLGNQALTTAWAGTSAIDLANQAIQTAWLGTVSSGGAAYSLAAIGTNVGTNALDRGAGAIDLANQALQLAWIGTNATGDSTLAYTALQTAWSGTQEASAAIDLANQALMTAWVGTVASGASAYSLAAIGTNVGTNALDRGAAAINLANQALTTAWIGTTAGPASTGVGNATWAAGSVMVNLAGSSYQQVALIGDTYFGATGYAPGLAVSVKISGTGSVGLSYDPNWKALSTMPTAFTQGATGLLSLVSFGTDASSTAAAYASTDFQGTSAAPVATTGTVPASSAVSGTLYYDFAGSAATYQTTTVDRTLWLSAKNMAVGREIGVILVPDSNYRTVGYSEFKWFGTTPPYTLYNKEVMLALSCFGTTLSSVRAAPTVQV